MLPSCFTFFHPPSFINLNLIYSNLKNNIQSHYQLSVSTKCLKKSIPLSLVTLISITTLSISKPVYSIGIHSQLLDDCNNIGISCVSSQDDTPSSFLEPWQYDDSIDLYKIRQNLLSYILNISNTILEEENSQYLRFHIHNQDILEFYFPNQDNIIHFRSVQQSGKFDFWRNRRRLESLRLYLGLEQVTILRNRISTFPFFQTPFDQFGPSAVDVDKIIQQNGITSKPIR